MRRLAVALLVAGLAVLSTPVAALAAPPGAPLTGRAWLRLTVTSQQPRMITASDTSVTMSGTLTNISDRRIREITARLQAGDAVTDTTGLRAALAPTANYTHGDTVFEPVSDSLAPGQSARFTVSADLTGPNSLRLTRPGVYPLLVNVQGVPDYSDIGYRLAVASVLLPVLAAPGGAQPAAPGTPTRLTILWPLVDEQPRVVSADPLVLGDDTLATSLGSGGRLFGLLDAVRQVQDDPGLLAALCFVVDPDLIATVAGMAGGYRVRTGAEDTTPGTGQAAAALWLTTLKTLVAGHCVLPLPYADADLAALVHGGGTDLLQLALTDGAATVRSLGGATVSGVVWPADNTLDKRTMTALTSAGTHTVLLNPDSVTPAATGPTALAGFTGAAPTVVPVDPVTSTALAPRIDEPNVDAQGISAQDGLAALVYQTVFQSGNSVLVAPPRRWTPSAAEALEFLRGAGTVLAGHYATPTELADAVAMPPAGHPVTPNYPLDTQLAEVSTQVVAGAVRSDAAARDVLAAMGRDHTTPTPVQPSVLVDPVRLGLLRAVSGAWRNSRTSGAQAALDAADAQFDLLKGQVTVVQPGLPILLGSKDSRLPVTVTNKLPVDIEIRIDLTGDPGLPSTGVSAVIPAGLSITVLVPATVTRSGRLSVYATVVTPGGTELGQQARLELVSNAYGTIIVIVTAIAFALLVLLSGRRIYRRVRAARTRTPQTPPDPVAPALVGARPDAPTDEGEPGRP